jgi:hypothetical protein
LGVTLVASFGIKTKVATIRSPFYAYGCIFLETCNHLGSKQMPTMGGFPFFCQVVICDLMYESKTLKSPKCLWFRLSK